MSNIDDKEILNRLKKIARIQPEQEVVANEIEKIRKNLTASKIPSQKTKFKIWRSIMKSKITKLTAAAVIIIAVILSVTLLDQSATLAYALEQTIQANNDIRAMHVKLFGGNPENQDQLAEMWMEYDENGDLYRSRMESKGMGTNYGANVSIFCNNINPDEVQLMLLLKDKNIFVSQKGARPGVVDAMINMGKGMAKDLDPKILMDRIYQGKVEGNTMIEIQEPKDKKDPIIMIADSFPEVGQRTVCHIDPDTNLITRFKQYKLVQGNYRCWLRVEILGYNEAIDPEVFTTIQIPNDAMRIDDSKPPIGLFIDSGASIEEIAIKVVHQYIEALIAEDYQEASRLSRGIPVELVRAQYEESKIKFLRVVSTGEPFLKELAETLKTLIACSITCTVEVEADGLQTTKTQEYFVGIVMGSEVRLTIIEIK